jgi:hypothetical protein
MIAFRNSLIFRAAAILSGIGIVAISAQQSAFSQPQDRRISEC